MQTDVYINQYKHCHQSEGQGYAQVFPNLAGNPIVILDTPEPTIEIVLHGRGSMPSFLHSLTDGLRLYCQPSYCHWVEGY